MLCNHLLDSGRVDAAGGQNFAHHKREVILEGVMLLRKQVPHVLDVPQQLAVGRGFAPVDDVL
ncbi:MAG: hypothetical protein EXQ52_13150 [Bryobacterales bacterium]|nr:hypothetical protein [Bryobacterales bacterium]